MRLFFIFEFLKAIIAIFFFCMSACAMNGDRVNDSRSDPALLYKAVTYNAYEFSRFLLERDSAFYVNYCSGPYQETPLFVAIRNDRADFVELLLAHGARTDVKNSMGKTPLSLAKELGRTEIAALLPPD